MDYHPIWLVSYRKNEKTQFWFQFCREEDERIESICYKEVAVNFFFFFKTLDITSRRSLKFVVPKLNFEKKRRKDSLQQPSFLSFFPFFKILHKKIREFDD